MIDFLPVHLDLSIPQGVALSRTVWYARTGQGSVIDLSNASGYCYISTSPMIWQNATPTMYTIDVTTDLNGAITLSANASVMSLIPALNMCYNVILTDQTDQTSTKMLYGVMQIEPLIMTGMPPVITDAESNTTPIINE